MKSAIFSILLLASHQAFAAGAVTWSCASKTSEDVILYHVSMVNEMMELRTRSASESESVLYVKDTSVSLPVGKSLFVSESEPYPAVAAEVALQDEQAKAFDFSFLFLGQVFNCKR